MRGLKGRRGSENDSPELLRGEEGRSKVEGKGEG